MGAADGGGVVGWMLDSVHDTLGAAALLWPRTVQHDEAVHTPSQKVLHTTIPSCKEESAAKYLSLLTKHFKCGFICSATGCDNRYASYASYGASGTMV